MSLVVPSRRRAFRGWFRVKRTRRRQGKQTGGEGRERHSRQQPQRQRQSSCWMTPLHTPCVRSGPSLHHTQRTRRPRHEDAPEGVCTRHTSERTAVSLQGGTSRRLARETRVSTGRADCGRRDEEARGVAFLPLPTKPCLCWDTWCAEGAPSTSGPSHRCRARCS